MALGSSISIFPSAPLFPLQDPTQTISLQTPGRIALNDGLPKPPEQEPRDPEMLRSVLKLLGQKHLLYPTNCSRVQIMGCFAEDHQMLQASLKELGYPPFDVGFQQKGVYAWSFSTLPAAEKKLMEKKNETSSCLMYHLVQHPVLMFQKVGEAFQEAARKAIEQNPGLEKMLPIKSDFKRGLFFHWGQCHQHIASQFPQAIVLRQESFDKDGFIQGLFDSSQLTAQFQIDLLQFSRLKVCFPFTFISNAC